MVSSAINESNLSLIGRKTMRLLDNHQLIPTAIQPISISLEQICYKRSQDIAATSLHCLLFSKSKNKDLKRILNLATNAVLVLKFLWTSVCFSLVTSYNEQFNYTPFDQSDY